jgi:hypothetical protein
VEAADILPKYREKPEDITTLQTTVKFGPNPHRTQQPEIPKIETMFNPLSAHTPSRNIESDAQTSSNVFSITQSFVLLPSRAQMECSQAPEQDGSPSTTRNETSDMESRSIKSSSSTESFKSAISLQEVNLDIARQVKAVQALMHAFRTALQILHNLIERRMPDKSGAVYIAAKELQDSLHDRSKEINDKHLAKFKEYGQIYLGRFTTKGRGSLENAQILTCLPVSAKFLEISSKIMQEVVMKLHEFSAEHEDLQKSGFEALCECSENCSRQIIMYLNQLAPSKEGQFDH